MMNVKDLIEILQRLPQDAPIVMHDAERSPAKLMGVGELHCVVHLTTTLWIRPSIVLAEHRDSIVNTLSNFGLTHPRVFGSVLRGTDTGLSDLDLLVDPAKGATLLNLSDAMIELKKSLGILIDLKTPGDLPEKFRDQVLKEARPL